MLWVLFISAFVLFDVRNMVRFSSAVHAYEVKRSNFADDSYVCEFYWRGCKYYGYFFYERPGEPPEDIMLNVVGIDCESGLWHLEVCDNE